MTRPPPTATLFPYTTLFRSNRWDRLNDEQKRMMLEQVHHDADRVTRLIGELLDISRLETGRLVLHRQLVDRSEEHTSELQSRLHLVCRLLLEKKKGYHSSQL